MREKMKLPKDEFIDIAHKLQETLQSAKNMKDGLLVYLIERALFQADKLTNLALPPSNSEDEQLDLPPFMNHSYQVSRRRTRRPATTSAADQDPQ
jgi:hypothetical protein